MRKLLSEVAGRPPLHPELKALAAGGFTAKSGCQFLSALLQNSKSVTRKDFPDAVGLECFVNSVHIDDYDVTDPLLQAIVFVEEVLRAWKATGSDYILVAIISSEENNVVVKFHLKRDGQRWLAEDLDRYLDAILVAEISSKEPLNALF
ncbi:hypothetical protein [Rhizobium sp. Root1203]|uniref:hypothetical protein n=1 Tax=Rhizobium sp. Root1203 TaxID=1736427 RepID=UPI00070C6D3A|nr:hypothetical protein [Rhizobium sp. Root1203]